jgi:hypothetical protein
VFTNFPKIVVNSAYRHQIQSLVVSLLKVEWCSCITDPELFFVYRYCGPVVGRRLPLFVDGLGSVADLGHKFCADPDSEIFYFLHFAGLDL